jgi:hypothetical protein
VLAAAEITRHAKRLRVVVDNDDRVDAIFFTLAAIVLDRLAGTKFIPHRRFLILPFQEFQRFQRFQKFQPFGTKVPMFQLFQRLKGGTMERGTKPSGTSGTAWNPWNPWNP